MADTNPATIPAQSSETTGAATSPSTTTPVPAACTTISLSSQMNAVHIKVLVPMLDVQANNYSKWLTLFLLVVGKYNVMDHVEGEDEPDHDSSEWVRDDLCVLGWIYSTISDELFQLVSTPNITAYGAFTALHQMFRDNKMSRAVHLEAEFHSIVQGDMSISAYYHKLKAFADGLRDCDQNITENALVLQLI